MGVPETCLFLGGEPAWDCCIDSECCRKRMAPAPRDRRAHACRLTAAFVAGASRLPFGILRGGPGYDLLKHTSTVNSYSCPFTGETVLPSGSESRCHDHSCQRADAAGNVQLWGIAGIQKEAALASPPCDRDRPRRSAVSWIRQRVES